MNITNRIIFYSLIGFFCFDFNPLNAQTASNVLETGIPIGRHEKICLNFSNNILNFNYGKYSSDPSGFVPLNDSAIFLPKANSVNIFVKPLNPLNYSFSNVNSTITDPIDQDAEKALGSISSMLSNLITTGQPTQPNPTPTLSPTCDNGGIIHDLYLNLDNTIKSIQKNNKGNIAKLFTELKNLTFNNEVATLDSLNDIKLRMDKLQMNYTSADNNIEKLKKSVTSYKCQDTIYVRMIFVNIIATLTTTEVSEKARYQNLKKIYSVVDSAYFNASKYDDHDINWATLLCSIPVTSGKISICSVSVNSGGYEIKDSEIVTSTSKVLAKKLMLFRKFQLLIPEVLPGIAYCWLTFPKYGVTTDSVTKKQYVSSAGNEVIKNFNFTAMVNFNFFIQYSPVVPFFQIGIGANTGYPTLLAGGGFRFHVGKIKFAVGGGITSTWIQTLNKLHIGDEVTGTAQLENDLTYKFNWPLKPYVSFQMTIK
jgi:hypothetical protein